jgi:endonuclease/exonuclease/phosphatase family metal-dependent hydrolase
MRVSTRGVFVRVAEGPERVSMSNIECSPRGAVRLIHQLLAVFIVICGFAAGASAQTTVTLSTPGSHVNADVTIQGGAYDMVDFSTSDVLASKVSSASYTRRILLKFDTQNFIPAGAVIQSAYVYLVLKKAESSERRPLTAYHVTKSFAAGQTNWRYFREGQAWGTPGGDLGPSFGITYVDNAVGSPYKFDLTQLVQRAVKGEFGSRYTRVALVDTGAQNDGNYREFHSTRAANAAVRPRLVITYGTSTSTPTLPKPPSTGTTLRVMHWNIHKTKGSDGVCNPDRIVNTIAAQNVHVVSLNEVNFFAGACAWNFDMGEKLQSLLTQATGVTWYRQNANAGGVGNVLLSRYPPSSSSSTLLSYGRGVAQMGIVVNGRNVNLFSTHVEYDNAAWRPIQIGEAVRWTSGFAEPRIVMGDFNTNPGTSDYSLMSTPYQDAWVAAKGTNTATSYNGTGATHGNSRFDYVFHSRVSTLALESVNVPATTVGGVSPSDHDPVIAVFIVK